MKKTSLKKSQSTLLQTWGYFDRKGAGSSKDKPDQSKKEKEKNAGKKKNVEKKTTQNGDLYINGLFDDFEDDDFGVDDSELIKGMKSIDPIENVFLKQHFNPNTSPECLPGFDSSFGSTYIYPTNYPVRDYQFTIIKQALLENTLVVLPTGLGKTFIAAVVMYNFYRWYPQGKLIFMAPTKPLVAQQIEACYNIMGIPQEDTVEMTGAMNPQKREAVWKAKRVFFLTPQVMQNDISRGTCFAEDVVCLVFDEAHRALGNHAYCQVLREVARYHLAFRVLALSATPGDDMKAVQQVVDNLLISHIEIRTEDSPDIEKYSFERQLDKIVIPPSVGMKKMQAIQLQILNPIVSRLCTNRALWQNNAASLGKFSILQARAQWRSNNTADRKTAGTIEADFALAMSLYHAYEVLQQHGILSFYNFLKGVLSGTKGSPRTRVELSRNPKFMNMMEELHMQIEPNELNQSLNETIMEEKKMCPKQRLLKSIPEPLIDFASHPKLKKLEEIVLNHFEEFEQEKSLSEGNLTRNTRVIIFSQYRDSVQEITAVLSKHEPIIRVMSFIGQGMKEGSSRGGSKGLSQKEQLEVIRKFRCGDYNTVVSTSVGEEGLDIGDVDLIICFDAPSSPIRLVQRMGRTGRKRKGRIIMLVSEGKEEGAYQRSLSSKKGIHKNLVNAAKRLVLFKGCAPMIPKHVNPVCYKMSISMDAYMKKSGKRSTKSASKAKSSTSASKLIQQSIEFGNTCLNRDQQAYIENEYFGDKDGCPKCQYNQSINKSDRFCSHVDFSYPLSLSKWCPWQTHSQPFQYVSHGYRTSKLCSIMKFINNAKDSMPMDAYEKSMEVNLNGSDLLTNQGSFSNKKQKKSDIGKAWRQNYLENYKQSIDSEDDDFAVITTTKKEVEKKALSKIKIDSETSDDTPKGMNRIVTDNDDHMKPSTTKKRVEKKALSKIKIDSETSDNTPKGMNRIVSDNDDHMKPCSFEECLERADSLLRQKKRKRIRLTKLPKIPPKDLNVSGIQDNQLDFCSQISMDTLYNRCMKKKQNALLEALYENESNPSSLGIDSDENSDSGYNECKVLGFDDKNNEICLQDEDGNVVDDNENGIYKHDTAKYNNRNMNNMKNLESNDNADNMNELYVQDIERGVRSDEINVANDKKGKREGDDVLGLLPMSTPRKRKPFQSKNVCVVTPMVRDTVPEPPVNLDLSLFKLEDKTVIKKGKTEFNSRIPEPPISDTFDFEVPPLPEKNRDIKNDSLMEYFDNDKENIEDKRSKSRHSTNTKDISTKSICSYNTTNSIYEDERHDIQVFENICKEASSCSEYAIHDEFDCLNSIDGDVFASPPIVSQCVRKSNSEMSSLQFSSQKFAESIFPSKCKVGMNASCDVSKNSLRKCNSPEESDSTLKTKNITEIHPQNSTVKRSVDKSSRKLQMFSYHKEESGANNRLDTESSTEKVSSIIKVSDSDVHSEQNQSNDDFIDTSEDEGPILKRRKMTRNNLLMTQPSPNSNYIDSDDSFQLPDEIQETKESHFQDNFPEKAASKTRLVSNGEPKKLPKKNNYFIEYEADDDCGGDSFEEHGESRINAYVQDSFIDDATQRSPIARTKKGKTCADDMALIYKQSLMSPASCPLNFETPKFKAGGGRFKLVDLEENYNQRLEESSEAEEVNGLVESDENFVCSEPEESTYQHETGRLRFNIHEISNEQCNSKGRKKKRLFRSSKVQCESIDSSDEDDILPKKLNKSLERRKKPLKRIQQFSSGSDNEDFVKDTNPALADTQVVPKSWCRTFSVWELPEITFSFGISWMKTRDGLRGKSRSKNNASMENKERLPGTSSEKPIVVIDSKCMSNSKIASSLRLKENCKVLVHEKLNCDYIVSKRIGIVRKYFSDITNGANSLKINECLCSLCQYFQKPFLIIEKDRVKVNSTKRVSSFSTFYAGLLSKVVSSNVSILYSEDQDETACLIGKLANSEKNAGFSFAFMLKPNEQQLLKLLLCVPKMTYPAAVELIHQCACLKRLLRCSLDGMKKILDFVPSQQVAEYYFFLQRRFDMNFIGSDKIK